MKSTIVGNIKPAHYDPDFYESEPYEIPYFDNRKLKIVFVETDEQYMEQVEKALGHFLKLDNSIKIKDSELVIDYYNQVLKNGYTKPLALDHISDIWNFVYPTEIILQENEEGKIYVCVSCECEWEAEHGLGLVFKNGESLTRASGHGGELMD